jgi:hypothetical protein
LTVARTPSIIVEHGRLETMMAERCLVFFRSGACDIDAAARSLAGYGLTVVRDGAQLVAHRPKSPEFCVRLVTESGVRAEAAEIGEGTPHEADLRECDAYFEINFESLDEALDEINTLMEVQGALQDASQGFLFLPWNGNLSEPWRG